MFHSVGVISRYGIKAWRHEGYRVTVLDVAPCFQIATRRGSRYRDQSFHMVSLHSKKVLRDNEAILKDANIIVDLTTAEGHSRWNLPILQAIARSKTPSLVLSVNVIQDMRRKLRHNSVFLRDATNYSNDLSQPTLQMQLFQGYPWHTGYRPADVVVYGGTKHKADFDRH